MKRIFYLSIILLLSCNSFKKKTVDRVEVKDVIANEKLAIDSSLESKHAEYSGGKANYSVFIDKLSKYDHADCYLSLYYRKEYSEEVYNELITSNIELIDQGFEETRIKLDTNIVKQHLEVDDLESLVVFDSNQRILDTVNRKNYEYYETMIDGELIATYDCKSDYSDCVVISLKHLGKYQLEKAPVFVEDLDYVVRTEFGKGLNPNYISDCGVSIYKEDTISFISYSDLTIDNTKIYFIKNGVVCDSVMKNYIAYDMKPVPITKNGEFVYVAAAGIPETDSFWNVLLSIDFQTCKVEFYERNRF